MGCAHPSEYVCQNDLNINILKVNRTGNRLTRSEIESRNENMYNKQQMRSNQNEY